MKLFPDEQLEQLVNFYNSMTNIQSKSTEIIQKVSVVHGQVEVILSLYRTMQFLIGAYQDYQSIYVPSKSSARPGKLELLGKLIKYSGQIMIINYT